MRTSFTEDVKLQAIKHNTEPAVHSRLLLQRQLRSRGLVGLSIPAADTRRSAGSEIGQVFDPGPSSFFESSEGKDCIATDYKSLNPGLTRIRAVVKNDETAKSCSRTSSS